MKTLARVLIGWGLLVAAVVAWGQERPSEQIDWPTEYPADQQITDGVGRLNHFSDSRLFQMNTGADIDLKPSEVYWHGQKWTKEQWDAIQSLVDEENQVKAEVNANSDEAQASLLEAQDQIAHLNELLAHAIDLGLIAAGRAQGCESAVNIARVVMAKEAKEAKVGH